MTERVHAGERLKNFFPLTERRAFVLRLFLFLFAVAIACPIRYWPVTGTLDNSWVFGLNEAAAHGLAMGRDILSTTGPLGYLAFPMDVGTNIQQGLWFQTAIGFLLLAVLYDLYFHAVIPLRNLALFTLLLDLSSPLFWFNRVGLDNLLLAAALISIVVYRSRGKTLRLVIALVLIGVAGLIKSTAAIIAAGALAGFLLERVLTLRRKAWRDVFLVILVPAAVSGICLLLTTPRDAFSSFLKSSLEVSSGYTVAMSFPGPPVEILAALDALLLVGLLLLLNMRVGRIPTLFFVALLAFPLGVSFKHGFVRQDAHIANLFTFCALSMALIVLSMPLERWRLLAVAAIVLPFLALWQDNVFSYHGMTDGLSTISGTRGLRLAWGASNLFKLRQDLLRQSEEGSLETLRIEPQLRSAIGTNPVGFLSGTSSAAIFLDKLQVATFPSIFPEAAYTPYLDDFCARWVRDKGPPFLLFNGYTFDKRSPWAEVPATWTEVYRWYDLRMLGKYNLLLQRRLTPRFSRMVPLSSSADSSAISLKDGFSLPPDQQVVFWTMDWQLSTRGRLEALLFRVPPVMMDVESADGFVSQSRVVLAQLTRPVIGALPSDLNALSKVFDRGGRTQPAMRHLSFGHSPLSEFEKPDAALSSYQPGCRVQFLRPE